MRKINSRCVCGQPATNAIELTFVIASHKRLLTAIPVCEEHTKIDRLSQSVASLPTHDNVVIEEVHRYPPGKGQIFLAQDGGIIVGCPLCEQNISLNKKVFSLTPDGLTPSFICLCGFHAWLKINKQG